MATEILSIGSDTSAEFTVVAGTPATLILRWRRPRAGASVRGLMHRVCITERAADRVPSGSSLICD